MATSPTLPEPDFDNLEAEEASDAPTSPAEIREPFDPREIVVHSKGLTIDLLLRRLAEGELTLQPDFQRAQVWTRRAQSRLIESMLIRLPLPLFYFDASDDDNWLTVDGLQRLTAIKQYVVDGSFGLVDLEFLSDFEGATFAELPRSFQRRIEETEVQVSLIQAGTPDEVKFNLFKRINTGGMPLSPQEIRHALNQGPATELLKAMAASPAFRTATAGGVAPRRMGDRELALRFLAFYRLGDEMYTSKDLDLFLHQEMQALNRAEPNELDHLAERFQDSMMLAHAIFGKHAFRKQFTTRQMDRSPVNKALFDAWSVGLAHLDAADRQTLLARRKKAVEAYVGLILDDEFYAAISQGTSQPARVAIRLGLVRDALEDLTA